MSTTSDINLNDLSNNNNDNNDNNDNIQIVINDNDDININDDSFDELLESMLSSMEEGVLDISNTRPTISRSVPSSIPLPISYTNNTVVENTDSSIDTLLIE